MNYTEIVAAALAYADRKDTATVSRIDTFLRIVEARINRLIRDRNQSVRISIPLVQGQGEYDLPDDYNGLRELRLRTSIASADFVRLEYMAPDYFNVYMVSELETLAFTIVGQMIQIWPLQEGKILELLYYQRMVPLTSTATENWMSVKNPDVYVFGLLAEICAFTKDTEATTLWEQRFMSTLSMMIDEDKYVQWSGPSPVIKVM